MVNRIKPAGILGFEWEEINRLRAVNAALLEALEGIVEIGKRDMSNPKYDGYFDKARAAIAQAKGQS